MGEYQNLAGLKEKKIFRSLKIKGISCICVLFLLLILSACGAAEEKSLEIN